MKSPFDSSRSISAIGEKNLIARICGRFGSTMPPYPFGAGDDCAVIKRNVFAENVFATSDAVILGVHFTPETSAFDAAAKLVKRNLSDLAAMGAKPCCALTSAILSKNLSLDWLDEFCDGLAFAAKKYSLKLVGGDVAAVDKDFFSMHLALLGDSEFPPLLRRGAQDGDVLYVTGPLGFSFESGRHLTFEPRLAEGEFLARMNAARVGFVSACTDLSDGLASDILNILSEGGASEIDEAAVPRNSFGGESADIRRALCDGEDYELLFALRASEAELRDFERAYFEQFGRKPFRIGIVAKKAPSEKSALILVSNGSRRPFNGSGYDHYFFS